MSENKTMQNIVIVSSDSYPDGGASANRHMAYAKGLVELGNKVTFILLGPQVNRQRDYFEDGIKFISVFSDNLISGIFRKHSSIAPYPSVRQGKKMICLINSMDKIDFIILLDTHVWMLHPFLKLCRNNNIKVVHERTEFPFVVIDRGFIGKIHHYMYQQLVLPKFDGLFVITQALKVYFSNLTRGKVPVIVINMIVDPTRFTCQNNPVENSFKYIAYCGKMDINKDGTDVLIRSYAKARLKLEGIRDIKLMLIGDTSDSVIIGKLKKEIAGHNCEENVIFTGAIPRHKLPDLLNNAQALVLARPDSKQAEGGFPTKLGEYLSTGKPVIITNTGEIGLFLRDGYNAFIAVAGSVDSFSEKLVQVFENYDEALKTGLRGKELVFKEFNYLSQAGKLAEFLRGIL